MRIENDRLNFSHFSIAAALPWKPIYKVNLFFLEENATRTTLANLFSDSSLQAVSNGRGLQALYSISRTRQKHP